MKKMLFLFLLAAVACGGDDETPTKPVNDIFDPTTATLLKEGMLMGVGHTVTGTVKLYDDAGTKVIQFDPFMSQNGPDLKVYLSKDVAAAEFIRLGELKSVTGKQSYQIPAGTDVTAYGYLHIWCEEFSVEFGRAELQ